MPSVDQVLDCQQGVVEQHARTGIAHYLADCLTPIGFVAMYGALGTGGFFPAEGAAVDAHVGVVCQGLALRTKLALWWVVMSPAIKGDHFVEGIMFALKTFGGLHLDFL